MEIGRVCVKLAGRDAGKKCVVVDILEGNYVLIDGATRRRKCNILHLEPLNEVINIKKGASHSEVEKEFKKLGYDVWSTKPKKVAEKPKKKRKIISRLVEEKKEEKKVEHKVEHKAAEKKEIKLVHKTKKKSADKKTKK